MWDDFGDPTQAESWQYTFTYASPTELQVTAPSVDITTHAYLVPIYIQSLGSPNLADYSDPTSLPSNGVSVRYAGLPVVRSLSVSVGPSTGGTSLQINGPGMGGTQSVEFLDQQPSQYSYSLSTSFTVNAEGNQLSLPTPGANPGIDDVLVCTFTGCSAPRPKTDTFTYFPPGNPKVSAISPTSGPAAGGTTVIITGKNLGCATEVRFGTVMATNVKNVPALLDCGSFTQVTATAPPGMAGTKVKVQVMTVGSAATGYGWSPPTTAAVYRYTN